MRPPRPLSITWGCSRLRDWIGGCLAAAAALLLLGGCADRLYFYPDNKQYLAASRIVHQERWVQTAPGIFLHVWWLPATGPAATAVHPLGTIVQLHGNAANLTAHVQQVFWLTRDGYNVVVWDYRGYGTSTGRPDRQAILNDTRILLQKIATWPEVQAAGPVFLLGQSLGGSLALIVAGTGTLPSVRGVIADSAFASWRGVAEEKLQATGTLGWMLSGLVPLLVSGGPDPEDTVARIRVPVLLLQGDRDNVVPVDNLDRLYRRAHPPVWRWRVHGAGHVEALSRYRAQLEPGILAFLKFCADGQSDRRPLAPGLIEEKRNGRTEK